MYITEAILTGFPFKNDDMCGAIRFYCGYLVYHEDSDKLVDSVYINKICEDPKYSPRFTVNDLIRCDYYNVSCDIPEILIQKQQNIKNNC